ncbi:hypothetical protein ACFQFQ_10335 [Sulfitobacter porphyrae]|uniref:Uncharacterized protein n=1 Tax=Sulfitobacter porphyrae TaxID=1246864 RepID=A0ABW2B275_9RHOB
MGFIVHPGILARQGRGDHQWFRPEGGVIGRAAKPRTGDLAPSHFVKIAENGENEPIAVTRLR